MNTPSQNESKRDRTLRSALCLAIFMLLMALAMPWVHQAYPDLGLPEEEFWARKKFAFKNANVLLLGDSRTYRGLAPAIISEQLPPETRILNFAFSGGGLNPEMYAVATERLSSNPEELRIIVLGITPLCFSPASEQNAHYHSIKTRWDHPAQTLFSTPKVLTRRLVSDYYQRFQADGWCASRKPHEDPDAMLKAFLRRGVEENRKVSTTLLDEAIVQTAQWRKDNVWVFGLVLPVPPAMQSFEEQSFAFSSTDFARRFEAAGGIWFDATYQNLMSYDGSHLRQDSAVQLSQRLGQFMAGELRKRWAAGDEQVSEAISNRLR
jgi:hypothetical protein